MKLEPRIHDSRNGLDYVLTDHYYLPALRLPEDRSPIGRWGRLHREYLKTYRSGTLGAGHELHPQPG